MHHANLTHMKLPEKLKRWRKRQGLSQAEAAALVGAHPSSWWRWEEGMTPMPVTKMALEKLMGESK